MKVLKQFNWGVTRYRPGGEDFTPPKDMSQEQLEGLIKGGYLEGGAPSKDSDKKSAKKEKPDG